MHDEERMQRIDTLMSHVWMVRTFLKHSEEAEEDEELCDVHRALYDYMHALGPPLKANDPAAYLKQARKKWTKLRQAVESFDEIQPEISGHTNFVMARQSLSSAVSAVAGLLEDLGST